MVDDLWAESILNTLAVLELPLADRERLGLPPGPLELRRAWPHSAGHLGLEYIAGDGHIVPGQWFADPAQLEHVAGATARAGPAPLVTLAEVAGARVLLQAGGADRRLPGLAPLLKQPGAHLLVHRPERRAVVRLETATRLSYAKVVHPERTQALAAVGSVVRNLGGGAFIAPQLLAIEVGRGIIVWSTLPGVSLYALSDQARLISAAQSAGRALKALHHASPPPHIATHSAGDEIGVLHRWLDRLEAFMPPLGSQIRGAAAGIFEALSSTPSPSVLLHRDFYDKQVFSDAEGYIGLLDFDTLATGEAALDLANALVHFELRALQGRCPPGQAAAAGVALLDGYGPGLSVRRRLDPYADAARLRLGCVYAFRPYGVSLVPALLARVGQPIARVEE